MSRKIPVVIVHPLKGIQYAVLDEPLPERYDVALPPIQYVDSGSVFQRCSLSLGTLAVSFKIARDRKFPLSTVYATEHIYPHRYEWEIYSATEITPEEVFALAAKANAADEAKAADARRKAREAELLKIP